jgi:hypothetical protein
LLVAGRTVLLRRPCALAVGARLPSRAVRLYLTAIPRREAHLQITPAPKEWLDRQQSEHLHRPAARRALEQLHHVAEVRAPR